VTGQPGLNEAGRSLRTRDRRAIEQRNKSPTPRKKQATGERVLLGLPTCHEVSSHTHKEREGQKLSPEGLRKPREDIFLGVRCNMVTKTPLSRIILLDVAREAEYWKGADTPSPTSDRIPQVRVVGYWKGGVASYTMTVNAGSLWLAIVGSDFRTWKYDW
jgi:hypothetical protein